MTYITIFLMALLVSLDAFAIGFLFGLKRIRIPISIITVISCFSSIVLLITMGIGKIVGDFIPISLTDNISGLFLIGLSFYHLFYEIRYYRKSFFLIITLFINIDNIGYGFQAGFLNHPIFFAPLAGLLIFIAFITGIIYGHITARRIILHYLRLLPCFLFFFLGVIKLLK
ncbi:manganese efflux pump [Bacillus sp. JCM 19034]|uniref:manganese efflux pump n=1 Tax=Bacillus sp. JCM 19034 TaxID=1481928 RepID=UPI0007854DC3|nr:manganese efflux pump [Bacillus sp. JCM 19034]